jgi:putative nucleotidyltransferase with HDIG domain
MGIVMADKNLKRILFVDEDPFVIETTRKMLLPLQQRSEIKFVNSGEQALALMAREAFDIIVVDVRMRGMKGPDLLLEVRERYPKTVRIVASEQAYTATLLKTADLAHQFIAKPFNSGTLIASLTRSFSLSNLLNDEKLRKLVLSIHSLPSLPSLYIEIMEQLQGPDPSADKVGEIISRDMGMTAKVLQLVNSAFFGLSNHVSNPSQAAILLGLETIRDLVLTIQVFSQFDQDKLRRIGLSNLWDHCLSVGLMSKKIARTISSDPKLIESAFLAGMLHDLGKLILAENFAMKYYNVIGIATRKKVEIAAAEREVFGVSHAQVGAYLLGNWGLPDMVIEAASYHHNPGASPKREFSMAAVVYFANIFDYEKHPGQSKAAIPVIFPAYYEIPGMAEKIELWKTKCL